MSASLASDESVRAAFRLEIDFLPVRRGLGSRTHVRAISGMITRRGAAT